MSDTSGTTASAESPETPKPLRVLIGADTFAPNVNGAARFAERLAAGLVARGHEVHVMVPAASRKHGTWPEVYEGQTVTAHRLYSWRWYPHDWLRFAMPWRIKQNSARVIDEVKPDVVHFQSHIITGRGLGIEAQKRGIRIIGTNHFMPENMLEFTLLPKGFQEWAVGLAWKAARRTFGRAEAVTTPTRKAADFLEKHTGLTGVHAISCGIDADNYSPNWEPRTENRILFVGRVTGEKQIDVLLRALTLLPAELDATVEIVGGGDQMKNLQQLAVTLGIADRVVFTGYVTDEELREAYHRATVLAMPSIAELQSIVTMEAMASALPVVAANAMALPHLVHDGENGYLFEPSNAQDLADKLKVVLEASPEEFERLKKESIRLIAAHDINRTLSTFESLYRGEPVADPVTEDASATRSE
ncbi:glycosyltransferase [Agromyces atrinae]|uniref:D-inositol 3-phosphate glycosyltransferase n=1 Tax=Agromyces atrinae TaxID=592376 RepID=A0A4V1R295_9MICO|nr:glycosyltransferase [Agromyces atrinae]NYD66048.1 glycosyltransferase involved in cell wall biosynthesis [Agromyces atrinae]RXZ86376.1 glycosyltransferase family 4 protein [Agromyces atrinae]